MHLLNNADIFYFYEDACDMYKGFQIMHMTSFYFLKIIYVKHIEIYRLLVVVGIDYF